MHAVHKKLHTIKCTFVTPGAHRCAHKLKLKERVTTIHLQKLARTVEHADTSKYSDYIRIER